MTEVTSSDVTEFKNRQHAMWAAGDYASIAERIWVVGERAVSHARVESGDQVLDVACGTGNAAIRAAHAGGDVVGLDLTPELFEAGRALAAEAGVEIDWVEGDAEALPFDDESFDAVVSVFGCMFAPRHEVASREIVRVLRPAGRFVICAWTPEGAVGDFFLTTTKHLPPPPSFARPPLLWGTEDHVRGLFDDGIELEFARENVDFRFDSVDAAVEEFSTKFGPVVKAKEALEPQGRWPALRDDLAALFDRLDAAPDDEVGYPGEYLVTLGQKRV